MRVLLCAMTILAATALVACGEAETEGGGGDGAASGEPVTLSVGVDSFYKPMFLAGFLFDRVIRWASRRFLRRYAVTV